MCERTSRWTLGLLLLAGCGIDLESRPLPPGHPASIEASESPYTPPPNLLSGELPVPPPQDGGSDHHHHGDHDHGEAPTKPYPVNVCLVGGEELGKMGKPVVITHEGREIKFCCGACVATFKKDPAKYLSALAELEKKVSTQEHTASPDHAHGEKK